MNPESPCLPVVSLLAGSAGSLRGAAQRLRERWPTLRLLAPPRSFDVTEYYREEMGAQLFRWWGYRPTLDDPLALPSWKQFTRSVESRLADDAGDRTVNIDPGYLNYGLVVLASHKPGHHRVPLTPDVYADVQLYYHHGSFDPLPWSFPDFEDGRHDTLLEDLRERYRSLRADDEDGDSRGSSGKTSRTS